MKRIIELYHHGLTYMQYLETGEIEDQEKHLYYLNKVELSETEKSLAAEISKPVKLLVFCEMSCRDCRIVLSILENMRRANPSIQYRIVNREGNRDVMKDIYEDCRIPLIVKILNGDAVPVLNEIPESICGKMKNLQPEEAEFIRQYYRKGAYKKEVLSQILGQLRD